MRSYFADAWFFIALLDRNDHDHQAALRLQASVERAPVVTHDAVFIEVLAFFSDEGPHARRNAVLVARQARAQHTVVETSRALFDRALDLYSRRPDKEYSLVDCMSMELMKARGITHVLTNDHHFRQEGFTVLSDAP